MINFKGLAQEGEIVRLLADLVAIKSVNPGLKGGQRGEAHLADYVAEYLAGIGRCHVKAHTADEWMPVAEVVQAAEIYAQAAVNLGQAAWQ